MPFVIDLTDDPVYQEGLEEGKLKEKIAVATSLLDILDDETIAKKVGLTLEEVKKIRKKQL